MGSDSARGAPREAATPPAPRKRHRLRGCCLGTLAALLLLAAAAVWISPLPEQWGIRQPASVKVFGEQLEPDRSAELELRAELEQAGLDTTGLYAYVLPYNDGRQGAALYAVLDSSQGFRFPTSSDQNAMLAYMVQLANSPALATAGVDRIALDYRDASGESVLITTAPAESIRKFARGEIGREAFFQELEARTDPGSLTEGVLP